ncbi:MAG TPA: ABC transporter substrate-binding protein [Stellaceae bacterium]|nr:ABC transporter substrate-binding protein [Stellaceae bacterium]
MTRRKARLGLAALLSLLAGAACAEDQPLKIGLVGSFSGGATEWGLEVDAAFAAYQKEHGDTVAGRKIEFIRRDTTGPNPDVTRRLVQELISNDKVELIAGLEFTPNALATAGLSTQAKMPVLIVNAATTEILTKAPYMVRFGFTTAQVVTPFAKWAAANGYHDVYAIYTDYGPGLEAGAAFKKAFTAAGGNIVGEVKPPLVSPDYSSYIQRVKDAKPQAIFIFAPAADHPPIFLKAYRDAGLADMGVKILATGDLTNEFELPTLGDPALGMITTFDYSEAHDSPMNHDFVKAIYESGGGRVRPNFTTVAAWDVINAIYKLVDAQHGKIDPDKTIALLKGMSFESPRGPIAIDDHRDIVQNVYFRKVEKVDGKLQNVEFQTVPMVDDHGEPTK